MRVQPERTVTRFNRVGSVPRGGKLAARWARGSTCFALILFPLLIGCRNSTTTTVENLKTDFVILATCDTAGWIEPCGCAAGQSGGLSRRSTLMKQLSDDRPSLIVSVGGAASGTRPYDVEKFRAIVDGETAMGYEIHNQGRSELRQPMMPDSASVRFLSTNTIRTDRKYPASMIVSKAGWKILVLGVAPQSEASANGVQIRSPEESILRAIESVDEPVDAIVVLAYMDREGIMSLAETLPEVDVIIGGHTDQSISPVRVGQTWVTAVSSQGKFVARITATVSQTSTQPTIQWSADLHEVADALAEDPIQTANLRQFRDRLARFDFAASQTSFVPESLPQSESIRNGETANQFAGSARCQTCHEADFAVWQSSGHADAWETLVHDGAHVDPYCQQCHTTLYGRYDGFERLSNSAPSRVNVGCESCHGPSSGHSVDPEIETPWQAANVCVECHDHENSPQFQYNSYWKRIVHGTSKGT